MGVPRLPTAHKGVTVEAKAVLLGVRGSMELPGPLSSVHPL